MNAPRDEAPGVMPKPTAHEQAPGGTSVLRSVLALAGLHVLLSVRLPWEATGVFGGLLRVSPDLLFVLSVAILVRAWRGTTPRGLLPLLAFGALLVPVMRFAVTVMPAFYGKELDLYNDVLMLPGLAHLLLHRFHPIVQGLLWIAVAITCVALFRLVIALVRHATSFTNDRRAWLGFVLVVQALLVAGWLEASAVPRRERALWPDGMLARTVSEVARVAERWHEDRSYSDALARTETEIRALPRDVRGLRGADVYVLFIESYGRAVYRHPESAERLAEWSAAWEAELAEHGQYVVSGAMYPSISGGASSLAHAEMMCGVEVKTRRAFSRLLESDVLALPRILQSAGYRTVNVQPATTAEWPEGQRFFGFDEHLFHAQLPYDGEIYHWGSMPDQYALAQVLASEVAGADAPLFVQYISVISHAPFKSIPPYLDDWAAAADAERFRVPPERTYPIDWLNYAGHPQLLEAHLDSLRYSLGTMVGFAGELTRPSLVLIVGDHQPPGVTELASVDSTFDVPIHVIASEEYLLAPYAAAGFQQGFAPPESFPSFSSALFLGNFLRATSAPEAASPSDDGGGG